MEKKLEKFMAEVRAGLREGSVISTHTAHTVELLDEEELWLGLRRELEDVGISPQLLSQKKDFIVSWIKTAIVEGTLEEVSNKDDPQLPRLTLSPQQNNALGGASSFGPVSPGLSPIKASERLSSSSPRLLSARRFLGKILQDDKKFLAAAAAGNFAMVTEQLKYGTKSTLKTALYSAAEHGHVDIVLLLLEHGANVNTAQKGGVLALYTAALNGHERVVKVLLDEGAEKEAKTEMGFTALLIAAEKGHEKVVKILLDEGAEKEASENNGFTALLVAAEKGHEKVVKVLLDEGAEKEAKTKMGSTALLVAAGYGHERVVKVLLDEGAEKEAKTTLGETALHIAALKGHETIVKVLLGSGANKEVRDIVGRTALSRAVELDKAEIVKLLE
jgi:ankyrin repeat protein